MQEAAKQNGQPLMTRRIEAIGPHDRLIGRLARQGDESTASLLC